jgi:uncharacterized protein (DUF433 family)
MQYQKIITINLEIMSGTPVFTGSRVPIQSLFWHLGAGISIEEFIEDFPSVQKEQIIGLFALLGKTFSLTQIAQLHETTVR